MAAISPTGKAMVLNMDVVYLPQYHARHTWITLALRAGMEIADVAYLARVSPGVIWSNYAGQSQKITVPEF